MDNTDTVGPITDQIKALRKGMLDRGFDSSIQKNKDGWHGFVLIEVWTVWESQVRVDASFALGKRTDLEIACRKLWELERLWKLCETLVALRDVVE